MTPADLDVLIMCGGRGVRLGALTAATPKPLLPIGGRPFLLRLLRHLRDEGITRIVLALHYRHERFVEFVEQYRPELPEMRCVVEPEPLGTGGGLRHALEAVERSTLLVLNGDSWVSQPLTDVLDCHVMHHWALTAVAVRATRVQGGSREKGIWTIGPRGEAVECRAERSTTSEWVNAGMYVMEQAMVRRWPTGPYPLESSFPALLKGWRAGVFRSEGTLVDIGRPDCYAWADQTLARTEAWRSS